MGGSDQGGRRIRGVIKKNWRAGSASLLDWITEETEKWSKVVKFSGAKPD